MERFYPISASGGRSVSYGFSVSVTSPDFAKHREGKMIVFFEQMM